MEFSSGIVSNVEIQDKELENLSTLISKALTFGMDINYALSTIDSETVHKLYNNGRIEAKAIMRLIDTLRSFAIDSGILVLVADTKMYKEYYEIQGNLPLEYPFDFCYKNRLFELKYLTEHNRGEVLSNKLVYIPFNSTDTLDIKWFSGVTIEGLLVNSLIYSIIHTASYGVNNKLTIKAANTSIYSNHKFSVSSNFADGYQKPVVFIRLTECSLLDYKFIINPMSLDVVTHIKDLAGEIKQFNFARSSGRDLYIKAYCDIGVIRDYISEENKNNDPVRIFGWKKYIQITRLLNNEDSDVSNPVCNTALHYNLKTWGQHRFASVNNIRALEVG